MSTTYTDDPRVTRYGGDGYSVAIGGVDYRVLPNVALGWGIYTGPNLDLVPTDNGMAVGFKTSDDAIAALLEPLAG